MLVGILPQKVDRGIVVFKLVQFQISEQTLFGEIRAPDNTYGIFLICSENVTLCMKKILAINPYLDLLACTICQTRAEEINDLLEFFLQGKFLQIPSQVLFREIGVKLIWILYLVGFDTWFFPKQKP